MDDPRYRETIRQLEKIEALASNYFGILLLSIALYALAAGAASIAADPRSFGNWLSVVLIGGVQLAVIACGAVVGGLLGFLFGIPRFLQQQAAPAPVPEPATADASADSSASGGRSNRVDLAAHNNFKVNTNLEEISDWLTKIIVGVSLIQARTIYNSYVNLINFVAAAAKDSGLVMPLIGVCTGFVLLAAITGGFLFFYMETRTRITLLLVSADNASSTMERPRNEDVQKVLQEPFGFDRSATPGMDDLKTGPTEADHKIITVPYANVRKAEELEAWAKAQARVGNLAAATKAIEDAVATYPQNRALQQTRAAIAFKRGEFENAADLLRKMGADRPNDEKIARDKLFSSLYLKKPDSFTKAIDIADRLLQQSPAAAKDAYVQALIAAAYGQKTEWLIQTDRKPEAEESKAKALEAVKKVVELKPDRNASERVLLRQLLDPAAEGSNPMENDLGVFKDDPEFRGIIVK